MGIKRGDKKSGNKTMEKWRTTKRKLIKMIKKEERDAERGEEIRRAENGNSKEVRKAI